MAFAASTVIDVKPEQFPNVFEATEVIPDGMWMLVRPVQRWKTHSFKLVTPDGNVMDDTCRLLDPEGIVIDVRPEHHMNAPSPTFVMLSVQVTLDMFGVPEKHLLAMLVTADEMSNAAMSFMLDTLDLTSPEVKVELPFNGMSTVVPPVSVILAL